VTQTIYQTTRRVETEQSNIIPPDVIGRKIDLMTSNYGPFSFLTRLKKEGKLGDNTYYWFDDLMVKNVTTLRVDTAAAATTWYVAAGTAEYAASWDYVWNRTKNLYVHVVAIDGTAGTDSWTVRDNVDGGTAVACSAGDELVILAPMSEEGGDIPSMKSTEPTKYTGYPGKVINAFSFTDEAMFSNSYFDKKDYDYQKDKTAVVKHARDLDYLCLFGGLGASYTLAATLTTYTPDALGNKMGLPWGIKSFLQYYGDDDHTPDDPDLTEFEIIDRMEAFFFAEGEPQNKKNGFWLMPPRLMTSMLKWNIGKMRFEKMVGSKSAVVGFMFTEWMSPFGPLRLVTHEGLQSKIAGGTHFYLMTDINRLAFCPYKGMDTHIVLDAVKDGLQRKVGYVRTMGGPVIHQPNAHVWGSFSTTS